LDRESPASGRRVTAACPAVSPPLIEQLAAPGRLVAPLIDGTRQRLTVFEKTVGRITDAAAARSSLGDTSA
jgi:protein-L-isoaspartate O-methyltransferase